MNATSEIIACGYSRVKATRHGYLVYNKHDQYVGRGIELYGEYSEAEIAIFEQIVRPGMVAIEAGANIGSHTIKLARLVSPGGVIHAFEPQRLVFQMLCGNLTLNGIANVFAYQAALARQSGTLKVPCLNPNIVQNFGALALGQSNEGEDVPARTIDELHLEHCHFLKLDLEGMELDAIAGAEQTVQTHKPILYVENDREDKSRSLIEHLMSLNYVLYWHFPPLFNPSNYYRNPVDVFSGIVSINMLGIHSSRSMDIRALPKIESPDSNWREFFPGQAPSAQ